MKRSKLLLMKPLHVFASFGIVANCGAELLLAEKSRTEFAIVIDSGATPPERTAAHELASTLKQITGAEFPVETNTEAAARAILVGNGEAARHVFNDVAFDSLGAEELVIKTKNNHLLLAGGRPRGTLYAVSRFLQQQCGARWWTPWESRIPKQSTLRIASLDLREKP